MTMTALLGEAALFIPGCEYCSAIPQSRQAILTALYRDIALFRPPYCGTPTVPLLYEASSEGVSNLFLVLLGFI